MRTTAKLKYFAGKNYMKKRGPLIFFVLLLPAAALAQEKTLNDISLDMFALVDAYTACATGDIACTGEDALVLQTEAENSLRDLAVLIRSGSVQRMVVSADQARTLSERASSVRWRLAHIDLFDAQCNRSIYLMRSALLFMGKFLFLIVYFFSGGVTGSPFGWIFALALTPFLLISMAAVLGVFVLMAPCLFWWL